MEKANGVDSKTESDSEPQDINRVNANVRKKSENNNSAHMINLAFIRGPKEDLKEGI